MRLARAASANDDLLVAADRSVPPIPRYSIDTFERHILDVADRLVFDLRHGRLYGGGVADIASAGLNVAIRVAPMKLSDLIATRLGDNPYILYACPAYVARFGAPATIGELAGHRCIKLHVMDGWSFRRGSDLGARPPRRPTIGDTVDAGRAACIAGVDHRDDDLLERA